MSSSETGGEAPGEARSGRGESAATAAAAVASSSALSITGRAALGATSRAAFFFCVFVEKEAECFCLNRRIGFVVGVMLVVFGFGVLRMGG